MRWILESLEAVGHTSSSSAQVTVCSPVAEDHLSLKVLNGIFTSVVKDLIKKCESADEGAEKHQAKQMDATLYTL